MAFPAKYRGFCLPCGEDIQQGEYITNHSEYGYIHEECTDIEPAKSTQTRERTTADGSPRVDVLPRGKTGKDKCNKCFIVHSPGQGGCE